MEQVHRLSGPTLVLTVGPAASGKSTLLHQWSADGTVDRVVSTDAVRGELGLPPDEVEMTYAIARRRVGDALREGCVVAVDATNVRAGDRAAWLAVAAGATTLAVRVGVGLGLEQLLVRDAGRARHVPAGVVAEQLMLAAASTPAVLAAEGFDVVDAGTTRLVRAPLSAPAAALR